MAIESERLDSLFFDSCFLTGKGTQVVQFSTTYFTDFVNRDAFFPFSDCAQVADEAGIKAIVQPGGSIRDQESIDYCDEHDMTMVFNGYRHFRH